MSLIWKYDFVTELSCDDGEFRCGNETKCMSLMWQCDGEEDCKDGSDERITTCSKFRILWL